MFIDKLNDGEKKVLIDLLMSLVKTDNVFAKREASHLLNICKKHGLEMNFSLQDSVNELCSAIKCNESKIIVLQELLWAAKIDCDYCTEEKEFIEIIRLNFGLSHQILQDVAKWVNDGIKWHEDGEKLLSSC